MKKLFSILIVLCIAATVFAVGSVKVGGAFGFSAGKTAVVYVSEDPAHYELDYKYKTSGFGFDVSGSYDLSDSLSVWADFNMLFNSDFKYQPNGVESYNSIKEMYDDHYKDKEGGYIVKNSISGAAGVAYKLALNAPVDVKVGGGLFVERIRAEYGDAKSTFLYKVINLGLALYADAQYKVADNIGVGLTVMPRLGIYNFMETKMVFSHYDDDEKGKSFQIGFSMPVVVGASYSF